MFIASDHVHGLGCMHLELSSPYSLPMRSLGWEYGIVSASQMHPFAVCDYDCWSNDFFASTFSLKSHDVEFSATGSDVHLGIMSFHSPRGADEESRDR